MTLASILALILQNPQAIESTVAGLVNMFKATTAPAPVVVPAIPATGSTPAAPAVEKKPSDVVRDLQTMMVQVVQNLRLTPPAGLKHGWPIKADGWLGDDTEKTIAVVLAAAKPYLSLIS